MENSVGWLAAVLVCAGLSFLFSGMETGVFTLSRLRLRQQARQGRPGARVLYGFLEKPEDFLWTILIGNTLANFVVVGMAAWWWHQGLGFSPALMVGSFLGFVFLFYAVCDLLPKMIFRPHADRLCLALARPFRMVFLILRPLVGGMRWFSNGLLRWTGGRMFEGSLFVNRDELRQLMQESARDFTSEEKTMINRVLDLQHVTVRQVAQPLAKVVTVTPQLTAGELLKLAREKALMRFPVLQTGSAARRIAGVVDAGALLWRTDLDPGAPVGAFLRPAVYVDEDLRLETALQRIRRSGQSLAIVLGRDRREVGIVTLQDILQFVFGEVSL